jgi:hypothetical protein
LVHSDSEDDDGEERHPVRKTKPDFSDFGGEELSAKFKEMSKQMEAMLAQQRRLSERRVPSDRLSPPRKARKLNLKENFDRLRKEAIVFPESDGAAEDYEAMSDQGSAQTPRKKFQPMWKIIGSKSLIEHTAKEIQQWLIKEADAEMRKCGGHYISRSKAGEIGAFRRSHVRAFD